MPTIEEALAQLRAERTQKKRELKMLEGDIATLQRAASVVDGYNLTQTASPSAATPKTPGPPRRLTPELIRDGVVALAANPPPKTDEHLLPGYFSIRHVAEVVGCHPNQVKLRLTLEEFVEKGMLQKQAYKGRGSQYVYIDLPPGPTHKPRGDNLLTQVDRDQTNVGSGNRTSSGNKDVDKLLWAAEAQGCTVTRDGSDHFYVKNDDGTSVRIGGTLGSGAAIRGARSRLKALGVHV